jgi:release factor glutamine methyltransferase
LTHYSRQKERNLLLKLLNALDFGIEQLRLHTESPEFEAVVLLKEASGRRTAEILTNDTLKKVYFSKFQKYVRRRTIGEPLQYIIGRTNFLGVEIFINEGTLIPRQETEFMTNYAIEGAKSIENPVILEVGTGSGAIAISMAINLPNSMVFASDISKEALITCKRNIKYRHLEERVFTVSADALEPFKKDMQFDIIISNPPYIPEEDLLTLPELVKKEPLIALNGGKNGVRIINRLLRESPSLLKKNGIMYIELSPSNIPYLRVPEELSYSIVNDQFGKKRILKALRK